METRTIDEVEIMRTGKWKDLEWTENDLDHLVENFDKKVVDIPLKITDNGDHDGNPLVFPGGASLGWVDKLTRVKDRLVARFKEVPRLVADLWQNGALKKKSVEGWENFETTDGSRHGRALTGLLLFGGEGFPAVHGLSDLVKVYKLEKAKPTQFGFAYKEDDYEGKPRMTGETPANAKRENQTPNTSTEKTIEGGKIGTMEVKQEEYQILLKKEAEHTVLIDAKAKLETENAEIVLKLENAETERAELKAKLEEYEEKARRAERKDFADFAHKLVETGKIKAVEEESVIDAIATKDGEDRVEYKKVLENRPILYKEAVVTPAGDPVPEDDSSLDAMLGALNKQAVGG